VRSPSSRPTDRPPGRGISALRANVKGRSKSGPLTPVEIGALEGWVRSRFAAVRPRHARFGRHGAVSPAASWVLALSLEQRPGRVGARSHARGDTRLARASSRVRRPRKLMRKDELRLRGVRAGEHDRSRRRRERRRDRARVRRRRELDVHPDVGVCSIRYDERIAVLLLREQRGYATQPAPGLWNGRPAVAPKAPRTRRGGRHPAPATAGFLSAVASRTHPRNRRTLARARPISLPLEARGRVVALAQAASGVMRSVAGRGA
jgi:hypothetical protein